VEYSEQTALVEMHSVSGDFGYTAEAGSRVNSFYGSNSYPSLWIDGVVQWPMSTWRSTIISRMATPSPITQTISGHYNPGTNTGTVYASFRNDSTAAITARVYFVITEDSLYNLDPNGHAWHNRMARDYLPNQLGEVVTINPGNTVIKSRSFTISSQWNENRCYIVAWIQADAPSRNVYQAGEIAVMDLGDPQMGFINTAVYDSSGNNNGRLDPGETVKLTSTLQNIGGEAITNLTTTIRSSDLYITVTDSTGYFGTIEIDSTKENIGDKYEMEVSTSAPNGHVAEFTLIASGDAYADTFEFSLIVGSYDYLIWNPDPTASSGQKTDSILSSLGLAGYYSTALAISDLDQYGAIFVCLGIYPNKYVINAASAEASALVSYLNNGGRVYMEGGDVWYFDPQYGGYNFCPLFGINAVSDGGSNLGPVVGESGTFTDGMNFTYGGENNSIDNINATGSGFLIFHDGDNAYNCGVANDSLTYRTVGTSFELGLLNDSTPPSTRAVLLTSIMEFFGIIAPDTVPPSSPHIAEAEKSGSNAELTWNTVATDTLGNPEAMDCYFVYRNTVPSFIPSASDSIGAVVHPDTAYTDAGVLDSTESYYYLVKAIDGVGQMSEKSNMGYVFHKFLNENTGATSDRNWVALPYVSEYDSVANITVDLSPSGNPITKITMLAPETQDYYSWIYHPVLGWYGNHPVTPNFPIVSGQAYEMIAAVDDTVIFVGYNEPGGVIVLHENPGATSDRNWISMPYNASYGSVSDITGELSPSGDPVSKITMLDEGSQSYYSWIYHPVLGWYGNHPTTPNFPIEAGDGYEFIAKRDTTWNPTEYSNEAVSALVAGRMGYNAGVVLQRGASLEPDRVPVWTMAESKERRDYADARRYTPVTKDSRKVLYREAGISHIVHVDLELEGFDGLVFTVYRPEHPFDVLTENSVGSVIAQYGVYHLISFDVGNFKRPWQAGEEVVLLIEALKQGKSYCAVVVFRLDKGVDIQGVVGDITLVPIPEPVVERNMVRWSAIDDEHIVGYSLYRNEERLNDRVIIERAHSILDKVSIRPVIFGGYETVYSSQGVQSTPDTHIPLSYAFGISPNPFARETRIEYALPIQTSVEILIYDVSGRCVKTFVTERAESGNHSIVWNGTDEKERAVASGVYFIRFETEDYRETRKLILLK